VQAKATMKTLHLAPQKTTCGIATYTANLINGLKKYCDKKFFGLPEYKHWTNELVALPTRDELNFLSEEELKNFFISFCKKARSFDAVHIQNEWGLFGDTGASLQDSLNNFTFLIENLLPLNKNVTVTFHSEPDFLVRDGLLNREERRAAKIWKKKLLPLCSKLKAVVHSQITKKRFIKSGFEAKNLYVITHGVLENRFLKERSRDDNNIIISLFGHLASYKGYELALDVLKLLPPHYRLCIIGGRHPRSTGSEINDFLLLVRKLELEDQVLLTGEVNDEEAAFYHGNTDICIAPHQADRLSASGAITWSLTAGCPVIASNVEAFRDIQRQENCLLLCDKNSPHEWAWAIQRCGTDGMLRKKLIAGASKYCEKFSWSNVAPLHVNVYKS